MRCGRSLLFGGDDTVSPWRADPRVEIHGAGRSKILLGPDVTDWRSHLDLLAASVADNGGRSCLNASGVWTPADGLDLGQALAERLARVEPRPLHDPEAALAAFPEPRTARAISAHIDRLLAGGGARDLTARDPRRRAPRRGRRLHLPAAHGGALRGPVPPPGQHRVPLPLRRRRGDLRGTPCSRRSAPPSWPPP